jgi:hypothetical protein
VKPSRRHFKNLTDCEKTGWKYSITCANIPDTEIAGVPGGHPPVHRDPAPRVRRRRARPRSHRQVMGLRNLPSKAWQVNSGWVIAANIAADLAAWTRLLSDADLREAARIRSATGSGTSPPRCPRPAADPEDQPRLAVKGGLLDLLAAALRPERARLSSTDHPSDTRGRPPRRGRNRCAPGPPCPPRTPSPRGNGHEAKNGYRHNQ